ncbi:DUF4181 domain-containing protein [Paenibacillus ihbetae]|uniref:DUF4181 domain-containing protein n=1 Tax=Paenibacillus ihbetae TaxID=1870820 RepID=A0ABX3JZ28_9BACL|nr:DUF4181 domain-containing protein [Paenibacillus ihbetae]OOC61743.1 hypothetical protein BBD40_07680 [Paenibacillus ihbetae]
MFQISIILYAIVVVIGYLWMRKKMKVTYNSGGPLYKHINRFHRMGELTLVAVSLITVLYMKFVLEWRMEAYQDLILVLAFLHAFRSVVERRFNKESKQHLLSAYTSVSSLLLFLGVELLV